MTEQIEVDEVLPGDPDAVQQLGVALERAADLLRSAGDRVAALGAPGSVWEGPVAQAFLDHVGDLSRRVGALEADLTTAATHLNTWREGLVERRRQLQTLREEMAATAAGTTEAGHLDASSADGPGADRDRQHTQLMTLVDEHEAAGSALAQALRRLAEDAGGSSGALDGTTWLLHAETLLRQLDEQVGAWVAAQGPALSDAVAGISQGTAVGATVGQAAGSLTPGLESALGATVLSVAAAAPASHRLIAAARQARRPVPLQSLPVATFAAATRSQGR